MLKFILPNFFELSSLNDRLIHIYSSHKEFFNDEYFFMGQEGSLPFHSWNGGKMNTLSYHNVKVKEQIEEIFHKLDWNLILYNCANPFLLKSDIYDVQENTVLKTIQNGSNLLITSTTEFTEYLMQIYPQFRFVASEDYALYEDNVKKELFKYFKCSYKNLSEDFYKDIPKSKIIINISSTCLSCENYLKCRAEEQQRQLCFMETSKFLSCNECKFSILSYEDIEMYNKQGYNMFCMDTHGLDLNSFRIIPIYLNLFIKDEYRNIADLMLRRIVS